MEKGINIGELELALFLTRLYGERAAKVALDDAETLWARGEMSAGQRWFRVRDIVLKGEGHVSVQPQSDDFYRDTSARQSGDLGEVLA